MHGSNAALLTFDASYAADKQQHPLENHTAQAYGQTTYLITTLKRVPRGTEGAISAEGTLAGIGAALGFAALAAIIGQVHLCLADTTLMQATSSVLQRRLALKFSAPT